MKKVTISIKYAVESLTEALRIELLSFEIRVVLIEPGDFKTGFTANRKISAQTEINNTYRENFIKSHFDNGTG